jgi:hypothetical protein
MMCGVRKMIRFVLRFAGRGTARRRWDVAEDRDLGLDLRVGGAHEPAEHHGLVVADQRDGLHLAVLVMKPPPRRSPERSGSSSSISCTSTVSSRVTVVLGVDARRDLPA